ncbi:MAG: hypothetical protein M1308_12190 [Actinobacteria bacterium]|nr:hypothetical protein [Actinomycetota bacterium]
MILNDLIHAGEIEKRKQVIRDIVDYNISNLDEIPILITYFPNSKGYTFTEIFTKNEIQLEYELEKIKSTLNKVPNYYIPSIKTGLGYIIIQTIFGMEPVYGNDKRPAKYPDQMPYMNPKTKPIKSIQDIYKFEKPDDIFSRGLVPEALERVRFFMEETNHMIPTSCLDTGNGLLMTYELMETNLFFTTMKDDPKAINYITNILTDVIIDLTDKTIEVAGGIGNITSTEWDANWYPEGKKCYISSEMQSLYNPDDYSRFDLPYCNRQFEHFGPGFIHNCGPQTAIKYFWKHNPKPCGLTCEYYSCIKDYQKIKEVFKKYNKAVLFVSFTNMRDSDEMVIAFENLMNIFAPEVIVVPEMNIGRTYTCQEDPEVIYQKLSKVSKEYIKRMKNVCK